MNSNSQLRNATGKNGNGIPVHSEVLYTSGHPRETSGGEGGEVGDVIISHLLYTMEIMRFPPGRFHST